MLTRNSALKQKSHEFNRLNSNNAPQECGGEIQLGFCSDGAIPLAIGVCATLDHARQTMINAKAIIYNPVRELENAIREAKLGPRHPTGHHRTANIVASLENAIANVQKGLIVNCANQSGGAARIGQNKP